MPPRRLAPTAQQTTGPFFPAQYIRAEDTDLAGERAEGEPIALFGRITDALDKPGYDYKGLARSSEFLRKLVTSPQAAGLDIYQIDREDAMVSSR